MAEKSIGSRDLRQQLTDVLRTVQEQRATYIIETFGRPQAAIISMEEYAQFQQFRQEREAFFAQLDEIATRSAEKNKGLSNEQVLAIIEDARNQVASGAK